MWQEVVAVLKGFLPSYWDYGYQPLIILVAVGAILILWRTIRP